MFGYILREGPGTQWVR